MLRILHNRAAALGLLVIFIYIVIALFAEPISPFSPNELVDKPFIPPSSTHLMGTDHLGRDVLSRVIFGSRVSLLVAFTSAAVSVLIGVLVGAVAGYYHGVIDAILMRMLEMFQVIPRFLLALVVLALFGGSLMNLILVISLLGWMSTARITRGQVLSLVQRTFVRAAKSIGARDGRIIFREILPNCMTPIIVDASIVVASAILMESFLSFLGVSAPDLISWGKLLNESLQYLRLAPWTSVFPGLAITIVVLAFNLLGDGLSESLNPKTRSVIRGGYKQERL